MLTDAAGRSYTYGEISELLKTIGGQSVFTIGLPPAAQGRIKRRIELAEKGKKISGARRLGEIFMDLPASEDSLFRYLALAKALREGRTPEEAAALARKSMFDAGDITSNEKAFQKLALFYGFARNNFVNAVKNLTTIKGLKRISTTERVRQNLTDQLMGDEGEAREYSPSYAQTRVILNKIGFDPEKGTSVLQVSPPLASLDAVYTLADFIKLEPQGVLGGLVSQEYKALLGIEDKFSKELEEVPAEHMAILYATGADPLDVINFIITSIPGINAEPTSYVPVEEAGRGREIEGKEGRYTIPLRTPAQRAAYNLFVGALAFSGLAAPVTDYARSAGVQGTKLEDLSIPERIKFTLAAETPIKSLSPEKQAFYDRLSRLKYLQSLVKDLEKDENLRIAAEAPPEEAAAAEAKEAKGKARAEKAAGRERARFRPSKQINKELQQQIRIKTNKTSTKEQRLAAEKRIAELREEKKEAQAREAAAKSE